MSDTAKRLSMDGNIPEAARPHEPAAVWQYAAHLIDLFGPEEAQFVAAASMYGEIQKGKLAEFRAWKAVWGAILDLTRAPVPMEAVH